MTAVLAICLAVTVMVAAGLALYTIILRRELTENALDLEAKDNQITTLQKQMETDSRMMRSASLKMTELRSQLAQSRRSLLVKVSRDAGVPWDEI